MTDIETGMYDGRVDFRMLPCTLWSGASNEKGYGQVTYEGKHQLLHRLIWEKTYGAIPDGMYVLHHCDKPACYEPLHLWLGSNDDNMRDKVLKGRSSINIGSAHPSAILTEDDVMAIKLSLACGNRVSEVASDYGVSKYVISDIKRGKTWRHVP